MGEMIGETTGGTTEETTEETIEEMMVETRGVKMTGDGMIEETIKGVMAETIEKMITRMTGATTEGVMRGRLRIGQCERRKTSAVRKESARMIKGGMKTAVNARMKERRKKRSANRRNANCNRSVTSVAGKRRRSAERRSR